MRRGGAHAPGGFDDCQGGRGEGVDACDFRADRDASGAGFGLGFLAICCGEELAVVAENAEVGHLHLELRLKLRLGERRRTSVAQGGEQQGETDELAGPELHRDRTSTLTIVQG